jgi:hypothetical protein
MISNFQFKQNSKFIDARVVTENEKSGIEKKRMLFMNEGKKS